MRLQIIVLVATREWVWLGEAAILAMRSVMAAIRSILMIARLARMRPTLSLKSPELTRVLATFALLLTNCDLRNILLPIHGLILSSN
jgi:hypothetical protein